MTHTYKYLENNGRLGNQLWQIAATIRLAKIANDDVAIRPDWEYRKFFSVPDEFFGNPPANSTDGDTLYYQELRHIEGVEAYSREIFRPSPEAFNNFVKEPMYEELLDFDLTGTPTCSIHVRRGDYVGLPQHFPLPTQLYYQRAIADVLDEDPETQFFVFSDDIEWCKHNFPSERMHYIDGVPRPVEVVDRKIAGEPKDYLDLIAMSICNRHIIANSTFSWWGAWLSGDNRVIYPSVWYGSHPGVQGIPWRNMIPESWEEVLV